MTDSDFFKVIKRQRYQGAIFSYGIVTLLYLLREYEEEENYEECQIVLDSIRDFNRYRQMVFEFDLPTNIKDIDAKQYIQYAFAFFQFTHVH